MGPKAIVFISGAMGVLGMRVVSMRDTRALHHPWYKPGWSRDQIQNGEELSVGEICTVVKRLTISSPFIPGLRRASGLKSAIFDSLEQLLEGDGAAANEETPQAREGALAWELIHLTTMGYILPRWRPMSPTAAICC